MDKKQLGDLIRETCGENVELSETTLSMVAQAYRLGREYAFQELGIDSELADSDGAMAWTI